MSIIWILSQKTYSNIKMKKNLKIKKDTTIKKTFSKLNITGEGCLFVVDEVGKFLGTITDGDCRRALLKGQNLNSKIKNVYNSKPLKLLQNKFEKNKLKNVFIRNQVDLIPILNKNGKVADYIKFSETLKKTQRQKIYKKNKNSIVIMAGGQGKRMLPFTSILPKPLLPLKNQTVIEKIISNFVDQKFTNFTLSVNYKSKIIKSFFEELKPKYKIRFVEEKKPMGTIGSLSLMRGILSQDFFVCNCDTICNPNFNEVIKFHKTYKNILTIIASSRKISIPYGVCELSDTGEFLKINEKPNKEFIINTGMYLINKKIFKYISKKKMNIDYLIKHLRANNENVGVFPSLENKWSDVGMWENYNQYLKDI